MRIHLSIFLKSNHRPIWTMGGQRSFTQKSILLITQFQGLKKKVNHIIRLRKSQACKQIKQCIYRIPLAWWSVISQRDQTWRAIVVLWTLNLQSRQSLWIGQWIMLGNSQLQRTQIKEKTIRITPTIILSMGPNLEVVHLERNH